MRAGGRPPTRIFRNGGPSLAPAAGAVYFPNEKPGLELQDVCLRSPKPHKPIRKPRSPQGGARIPAATVGAIDEWARVRPALNLSIATAFAVVLGACAGSQQATVQEPGVAQEMPATVRADQIVGRWGVASYQDPKDRTRVEAAAKAQCPGSSRGWVRRSGVADHGGIQNLNSASRECRSIQPRAQPGGGWLRGAGQIRQRHRQVQRTFSRCLSRREWERVDVERIMVPRRL